jgi:diphthamide synthase (EF-2-diphthine--ammonia ligase)
MQLPDDMRKEALNKMNEMLNERMKYEVVEAAKILLKNSDLSERISKEVASRVREFPIKISIGE